MSKSVIRIAKPEDAEELLKNLCTICEAHCDYIRV